MKMKDSEVSWVGEIPENWSMVPFKSFLKKKKDILNHWENQNVLSLTMNGIIIRDLENPTGKMPATFDGYQTIDKGNFILCLFDIDVTPRCVGVANDDGVTSPAYSQYEVKYGVTQYYYYLLLMLDNDKILLTYSKTLRSTLTDEYFGAIKVPITQDIYEQKKIADFLDSKIALIDQIIADTKHSIEELKAYKQSLITETVTKGLDPNVPMKDSGVEWIGEMPKEWKLSTYKYIAKIRNGKEITVDGGKVPVYGSGGIFKWTNEPLFIGESVLFGRKGTIGEPMIASGEFWTVDTMYYTEINKSRCSLKYCYYLSKSLPWDFYKTKTALPSIVGTQIESIKIPLPDKEEQNSITKFLDEKVKNIDGLIFGKQNLITDYESYKKSLIYEYVTGKKRIDK
ncbi:restriction endonuclease subunit S [Lactococcus lactis]|uniref:restriction endonuclease subunit S n=1 Tax=Lactococcus lactis TaxID=1358 RepID=UPI001F58367F|nr:restriction endonuclease subunit S [Lactococcus lactis]